jgi:hypothetical protein
MATRGRQPELDDLGEDDFSEPIPDLGPDERRLFTESFDLSIQTVLEQWDAETLVLPEIQREYLWSDARASRLIESLILGIPIPLLYFAETPDTRWEIFDGHQRVVSVVRFVKDEFALRSLDVLPHLNGARFSELNGNEQRRFMRRMLRAVVITADSHPAMKYEIFERVNTGSVVLNPQELRNSLYRGDLNNLLHELARYEPFRRCIGTKSPRRRMVDEELVLRFFALRFGLESYRPPLKAFLNRFMASRRTLDDDVTAEFTMLFARTTDRVELMLGGAAFRLLDLDGKPVDRTANRAIFDAQMLPFSWIRDEVEIEMRPAVLSAMVTLSNDAEFIDASTLATGDRSRTVLRIKKVADALASAGMSVDRPDGLA